jgi:hypothetical protein
MALIGTMSALVLGLLVGSAKSSYDTQKDELTSLSAGVLLDDRMLSINGPEPKVPGKRCEKSLPEPGIRSGTARRPRSEPTPSTWPCTGFQRKTPSSKR